MNSHKLRKKARCRWHHGDLEEIVELDTPVIDPRMEFDPVWLVIVLESNNPNRTGWTGEAAESSLSLIKPN